VGKILIFFLLARLTGSPWMALGVLILFYWGLDRSTLRYLPGPWVLVRRFVTRRRLEATLSNNPHDFRTELELGRLLLDAKRYPAALAHLELAANAYQTDSSVQVLRAVARIGAGRRDEGVKEVETLMAANPKLRFGEPWLDAGELLLKEDPVRAKRFLETFLQTQPSNVKGLYLLGRATAKAGDAAAASALRKKAWAEYATNPKFKRREARVWAYRANPLRPAMYAAGVFAVIGAMAMLYRQ
jgi:tetratricopeptide (TPR) repeat protein